MPERYKKLYELYQDMMDRRVFRRGVPEAQWVADIYDDLEATGKLGYTIKEKRRLHTRLWESAGKPSLNQPENKIMMQRKCKVYLMSYMLSDMAKRNVDLKSFLEIY